MGSLLVFFSPAETVQLRVDISQKTGLVCKEVQKSPSALNQLTCQSKSHPGRARTRDSETSVVSLPGAGRIRARSASPNQYPRKVTLLKRVHLNNTTRQLLQS
jgi:hypothetical protein